MYIYTGLLARQKHGSAHSSRLVLVICWGKRVEDKIHEIVNLSASLFPPWATSHANLETYNKPFNPLFCYLSGMDGMDGRAFLVWASVLLTYYCGTNYSNICQLKTTFLISVPVGCKFRHGSEDACGWRFLMRLVKLSDLKVPSEGNTGGGYPLKFTHMGLCKGLPNEMAAVFP